MDNGLRFLEMLKNPLPAADLVTFHFLKSTTLLHRTRLKTFLIKLVKSEKKAGASLSYVFCSDQHLLKMNNQFLSHDYYTDILTFPLEERPGWISGEMYLSIDRIRDNARILDIPVIHELHRVIFHGALHLCGFRDKSAKDKAVMRSKEDFYLKKYFHP